MIPLFFVYGDSGASAANLVVIPSDTRKRRERYSGKFPRKYSLKYKELNNNDTIIERGTVDSLTHSLLADVITHSLVQVLKKGSTPAGMHVSIMVNETILHLGLTNTSMITSESSLGLNIVDCTLGYGGDMLLLITYLMTHPFIYLFKGHTSEIYKYCPDNSRIYGIDQDRVELEKTSARINNYISSSKNNDRNITFQAIHDNFMNIMNISSQLGLHGKGTPQLTNRPSNVLDRLLTRSLICS